MGAFWMVTTRATCAIVVLPGGPPSPFCAVACPVLAFLGYGLYTIWAITALQVYCHGAFSATISTLW